MSKLCNICPLVNSLGSYSVDIDLFLIQCLLNFQEFMANARGDYETQIILPLPFEAVFVRINPATWENSIALKVEFYGCSSNQPYIPGILICSVYEPLNFQIISSSNWGKF